MTTAWSTDAEPPRASRQALAGLLLVQAGFAALHLGAPGWRLVDLDKEHNLPTWFHSGLLALVALLALDLVRGEARFLRRTGQSPVWALVWFVVAGGFGYLAVDETLVIHEGLLNRWVRGQLAPASSLQLTLAWLLVFLPAIVLSVAFLLAALSARARLSPRLAAWGGAGLLLWVLALTLEATTKSFFIPRNLYWLEVVLEETAESLGTTCFAWGLWRYRIELRSWGQGSAPAFAVLWRWVAAGTAALAVPVGIVGASIAWNPYTLHRHVGDDHLRAGRLDAAVRAYRAALAMAPDYGRAWYRLGVAELRRGDLAAAEEALATAARLEPRNAMAVNDLGVVLLRQGRDGEAAAVLARAVALAPDDRRAARNLGVALRRLGREAEADALLSRTGAARLQVTEVRVIVPAEVHLAYLADPGIAAALDEGQAGRTRAAIAAYQRALATTPNLAAAHLGLGNELVRLRLLTRVATGVDPRGWDEGPEPQVSALFSDWIRDRDGRWRAVEAVVAVPEPGDEAALARQARRHFERALALGAAAPAHVGLAALARLDRDEQTALRHGAMAGEADASLPIGILGGRPTAASPSR